MIKKFKALMTQSKPREIQEAQKIHDEKDTGKKETKENKENYFQTAKSWADDIYTATIVSRNRYRIAFFGMSGLSALLAISIMILVPLQHTELAIIHQGPSGYVWVTTTKINEHIPISWARTQAEIAHYVIARESYDPVLYPYQTRSVNLLSNSRVQAQYETAQDSSNKSAPINVLGNKGYRTVTVNNVLLLDSAAKNRKGQHTHKNLAQVDFVMTDHLFGESQTVKTPYTALVSWAYQGIPGSPAKMLKDWDGFQITQYQVHAVNMGSGSG